MATNGISESDLPIAGQASIQAKGMIPKVAIKKKKQKAGEPSKAHKTGAVATAVPKSIWGNCKTTRHDNSHKESLSFLASKKPGTPATVMLSSAVKNEGHTKQSTDSESSSSSSSEDTHSCSDDSGLLIFLPFYPGIRREHDPLEEMRDLMTTVIQISKKLMAYTDDMAAIKAAVTSVAPLAGSWSQQMTISGLLMLKFQRQVSLPLLQDSARSIAGKAYVANKSMAAAPGRATKRKGPGGFYGY